MQTTLVAEIGSTTTIVNAFANLDGNNPLFIGQGFAPTSVADGDVLLGLQGAVSHLQQSMGQELQYEEFFATSSAAGGLKMTVHGLVYDMTVKAAQEAALGAGAVVKMVTAGKLGEQELVQIGNIKPNIILLAGGVDYGDKVVVLHNARTLGLGLNKLGFKVPIIYAGNVAAGDEVEQIIKHAGLSLYRVPNVYPTIDQLNVEPTRRVIQTAFEACITQAPGMKRIRELVHGAVMPTPGAVMRAAESLYTEIGDLMVIDVGGATTDVHSVSEGSEEIRRIALGPEPIAKRSVEGDLGVYVNAGHLFTLIGEEQLVRCYGADFAKLLKPVPDSLQEIALSRQLTATAVDVAVKRHAGKLVHFFGPTGRSTHALGKDLTGVRTIVGTGGALTRLPGGIEIVSAVRAQGGKQLLPPLSATVMLDNYYIFAAMGVVADKHPQGSLYLMRESMGIER